MSYFCASIIIFILFFSESLYAQPKTLESLTMLHIYTFKKVTQEDLHLLYSWFQEPHIEQWWPVPKQNEAFFDMFLKRIRSTEITPYLVFLNGKPFGYIQTYLIDPAKNKWLPQLPLNTIGIDQFIGKKEMLGKGHGSRFIKAFIHFINTDKKNVSFMVDPDPTNRAAIGCYEKIGFKKIGEFHAPWGPALIMHYQATL